MRIRYFLRGGAGLALGLVSFGLWAQTAGEMSEGEVRRIDRSNLKITIRHGEIKNLDMPPMSMVSSLGTRRCWTRSKWATKSALLPRSKTADSWSPP